jgi:signal transduction histidine kinase
MVSASIIQGSHIFEWRHKKISGEEFDCNISLTCINIKGKKLIQASIRDVTESKRDKDLLIKKEIELEYAERVAKLGRWSWDIETNKIQWSEVLKEIFWGDNSVKPPPYEGLEQFYSKESWGLLEGLVTRAIETDKPYALDLQSISRDGAPRWSHTTGSVIERNSSGKALKMAGTVQDITDRKKLENELHEALKTRDVFLGVASHELKTPLTTLQLQIHSLLRLLKADHKEFPVEKIISKLNIIKNQGERFEQLIKTLLDISQVNSGRLRLQIVQNMDLSGLVEDIANRFNEEFVHIHSDFKVFVEPQIKGDWDPQRVEQVISNLLSNALKYGDAKPVKITLRKDATFAYIEVKDHGIGIFERAVDEHSYKGLGLGLWIVREIVTSLKGEIWVESEVGKGSCFITKLPLKGNYDN